MKLVLVITAIFSAFYALSSSAANEWDIKTAYRLAVASDCAYSAENGKSKVRDCFNLHINNAPKGSDVLDVFKELPDNAIETFRTGGVFSDEDINAAILVKIPGGAIVAFRGTKASPQDWLHNIFLTSIENVSQGTLFDGGRHYGFNQSLDSLKKEIIKDKNIWLPFENQSGESLYITGHSKGGALATGATVDFAEQFPGKKIETYIFEAARFFTAKGANDKHNKPLLDKIWRFEYQYDLVPHVPLGKVTYDFLLEHERPLAYLAEKFKLPEDSIKSWAKKVEDNNINFVSVGKLAYVDGSDQLAFFPTVQPDQIDLKYYRTRFIKSLGMTAMEMGNMGHFVKEQHSDCYLGYLKAKATNRSITELSKNC
ncbi:lipase class 3 [Nitrosomonas sp. Is79A3]|uniref:lipase family protein n=1 Tax=Nitrosomonas sp. (strain Is79A3) TaxID=261292 RepID=UPI000215D223